MPSATLLLREQNTASLTAIVEKALQRKPPLLEYDLQLNSSQLDFKLTSNPEKFLKSSSLDEGFESDIDSISIVSCDEPDLGNVKEKLQETDSANGSACSDTDDADAASTKTLTPSDLPPSSCDIRGDFKSESFTLVDCSCYTDVRAPQLLLFVIKSEAFVFRLEDLAKLQQFYASFSALKAVANQKTYNKNLGTKFNLLQRTDCNGVTHIEIARENLKPSTFHNNYAPSSIISINTPENLLSNAQKTYSQKHINIAAKTYNQNNTTATPLNSYNANDGPKIYNQRHPIPSYANENQKTYRQNELYSTSSFNPQNISSFNHVNSFHTLNLGRGREASLKPRSELQTPSSELDFHVKSTGNDRLLKVWNSAEDLLDAPKKPERRKKAKGRAPLPPISPEADVLKGQFVRVEVKPDAQKPMMFAPKSLFKPKLTTYEQFQYENSPETMRRKVVLDSWTSSVPRMLKKQRSKSETRNFTPMAYRYIDTTHSGYHTLKGLNSPSKSCFETNPTSTISNRLFGMSSKLKDFSPSGSINGRCGGEGKGMGKWGSLGELSYKLQNEGSLKSVIKKDDGKRKNEKKVTFSAYTTVQVV